MTRIQVRPLKPSDISPAAALLAARHKRDRARLPWLNKAYEDPAECEVLVRDTVQSPRTFAVAAELDGQLAGYLVGERELHHPASLSAQFVPPYTLGIGLHGHAVAADVNAVDVYRLMYAELAARAVERGFFEHRVYIVPGDRDVEEAWVNLGFGRGLVCAVRDTTVPVPLDSRAFDVEVHQASSEDADVVMQLEDANTRHHYSSPIFWPYLHETLSAAREYQEALLADPANAHFVAYRDGKPLGMNTFNPPNWVSPLLLGGRSIYLFQGVVVEEARGNGVGKALLARSMEWAREQGYERCVLHFASANASGATFWLGQGFVPVEYTMARHIDERIGWARPA